MDAQHRDRRAMTAFDLDGVLCDFVRDIYIPAGERLLGRDLPLLREDTYGLREQLGIGSGEHARIWSSPELLDAMLEAPPINHTVGLLVHRREHVFITARGTSELERDHADLIRLATRRWLRRLFPGDHSPIHFVPAAEKTGLAMELGVRSMWEDHPDTALQLAKAGIRVSMPVFGYNDHLHHPGITRVEGWREPTLLDLLAV